MIAEIWQKALGVEKIGVLDNFFDLGGDSLIAIQAAAELKKAFQVDLPVVSLYEGLTIRSFAKLLSDIQREQLSVMTEPPAQSEKSGEDTSRRRLLQQRQRARRD
jgi:acyl carrier protein